MHGGRVQPSAVIEPEHEARPVIKWRMRTYQLNIFVQQEHRILKSVGVHPFGVQREPDIRIGQTKARLQRHSLTYIRGPTIAEIPSLIKLRLPTQVMGYVSPTFMYAAVM